MTAYDEMAARARFAEEIGHPISGPDESVDGPTGDYCDAPATSETYNTFLANKRPVHAPAGLDATDLHPALFPWQRDITRWALRKGRACLFEDCGLGKTLQQLAWAQKVPGDVLILAPLAVSHQTVREAERFGIRAARSDHGEINAPIVVTNYQRLHHFDPSRFAGVVLDESSILKAYDGATRTEILEATATIPYRLACTATPAPNDYTELGNHAQFVGAMTRMEMLAMFFVHDGARTSEWRLKGHAVQDFWSWVATWAMMVRKPSDIGGDDGGFVLPELFTETHILETDLSGEGELFTLPALALQDQRTARRQTMDARVEKLAGIVNASTEQWVVWCELNAESSALADAIDGAVEVAGAHTDDEKTARLHAFADGTARVIVTKPKIAGFGLNWQHCARVAFVGLSHSWEQFYQAVRRCWRFGQERPVEVHIISTDREEGVLHNIQRKQSEADTMAEQMIEMTREATAHELAGPTISADVDPITEERAGDGWRMVRGDCVRVLRTMDACSVDFSIFSPPFSSLYTYTDELADMGNTLDHETFFQHFSFAIEQIYRVTRPGRLVSFHCMDLPTSKVRDGVIGLYDFRGALIRAFEQRGWILHSQVCIWKDPVTAMQRTKALGLLYKQLRKDSCMSRQGISDYLVTMRKPGVNPQPVTHTPEDFPLDDWQKIASPVWTDIDQSDTLQHRSAREEQDERHICPLQLTVIRRALHLWSNPGDLVLSPFAGIGSEGVESLRSGRRFVGIELKDSYYRQAWMNLQTATAQGSLFE